MASKRRVVRVIDKKSRDGNSVLDAGRMSLDGTGREMASVGRRERVVPLVSLKSGQPVLVDGEGYEARALVLPAPASVSVSGQAKAQAVPQEPQTGQAKAQAVPQEPQAGAEKSRAVPQALCFTVVRRAKVNARILLRYTDGRDYSVLVPNVRVDKALDAGSPSPLLDTEFSFTASPDRDQGQVALRSGCREGGLAYVGEGAVLKKGRHWKPLPTKRDLAQCGFDPASEYQLVWNITRKQCLAVFGSPSPFDADEEISQLASDIFCRFWERNVFGGYDEARCGSYVGYLSRAARNYLIDVKRGAQYKLRAVTSSLDASSNRSESAAEPSSAADDEACLASSLAANPQVSDPVSLAEYSALVADLRAACARADGDVVRDPAMRSKMPFRYSELLEAFLANDAQRMRRFRSVLDKFRDIVRPVFRSYGLVAGV